MQAIIYKPERIATRTGIFAQVLHAVAPKLYAVIMNTAFRLFPESTAAKGQPVDGPEPSLEQISFAQFTRVQAQQLMPRPKHLTWEEAACYTLTLATAYRMLFTRSGLQAGDTVLIQGAGGGVASPGVSTTS